MLRNYLKIAVRTLRKHRGYAFINVAGLAIGMACCLLIMGYIQDERLYDRFHENADRIYRITAGTGQDGQPANANGGFSWAKNLEVDFAEIEHGVRFHKMGWGEQRVVIHGENRFYEDRFFFADPEVFEVFTFPFLAGDPTTALTEPNTVVVTTSTARKYLGDTDPMGQVLRIDPYNNGQFIDFTITGVLEDLPEQSHFHFDFLLSIVTEGELQGWGYDPVFSYVLLAEETDPAQLEAAFPGFLAKHIPAERLNQYGLHLHLQPITDIRLRSKLRAELEPTGDIAYVYLFSAVALLILIIACINFMNLATARSAGRAREVGMRKVLGAYRKQLVGQFLGEAMLLSTLATVLAAGLVQVLLPVFNAISGKTLAIHFSDNLLLLGSLLGLALLVGMAAGSYPAFFLSAFRPVEVLKGKGRSARGTTVLRKGLVVFQFGVSIFLIACTAVVYNQMEYVRSKNLGFDREQIIVLPLNDEIRQSYSAFRDVLQADPGVLQASMSEQVPARAGNGSRYKVGDRDERQSAYRLFTDLRFIDTYGLDIIAGRAFSEAISTDSSEAFLVNEAFVREHGWTTPQEALGKQIEMQWSDLSLGGQIVGVVKDFQIFSFREQIEGLVINVMPAQYLRFLSIRLAPGQPTEALAHLEKTWQTFSPGYPFDYYFLDQDFERLHRADEQLGQIFRTFAFLAILVACLGLFGLAAYTAEQRTKEIGVRKVLGASVTQITVLLSKDFTRLVLLAFVIAAPLAYLAMHQWLADFVYRVDISWWIFLMAGLAALGVAWLTISYQAIKAALNDPVKALRYE